MPAATRCIGCGNKCILPMIPEQCRLNGSSDRTPVPGGRTRPNGPGEQNSVMAAPPRPNGPGEQNLAPAAHPCPNGAKHQSPGQARNERSPGWRSIRMKALKGRDRSPFATQVRSVPDIRFVVFEPIQIKQAPEFILKRFRLVMRCLIPDVTRDLIDI